MAFSQTKVRSWVMPLSFFILFLYSVAMTFRSWIFFLGSTVEEQRWPEIQVWVDDGSFLRGTSLSSLHFLLCSFEIWYLHSPDEISVQSTLLKPKGIRTKWAILLRNSFQEFYTVLLLWDGEGNGTPLQCSCLENPRNGGVWWAAMYGVTRSRTRLKWLSISSSSYYFGAFKTETQNRNSRVVRRPDPTSFLDGLCKEVALLLF